MKEYENSGMLGYMLRAVRLPLGGGRSSSGKSESGGRFGQSSFDNAVAIRSHALGKTLDIIAEGYVGKVLRTWMVDFAGSDGVWSSCSHEVHARLRSNNPNVSVFCTVHCFVRLA